MYITRIHHAMLFLLIPILLWGCSQPAQTNSGTAPAVADLDRAEGQWQAQGITNYRISVEEVSLWHMQVNHITIADGAVVEAHATCNAVAPLDFKARDSGACATVPFEAEQFTVDALFAKARSLATEPVPDVTWSVTFDPAHGFPQTLGSSHQRATDSGWTWRVVAFEVGP